MPLDYNQFGGGVRQPDFDVFLIFRRAIAGERGSIVGKLDGDVAGTGVTFCSVELAAVFFEYRGIGRCVRLVAFLVFHIEARNPITVGYRQPPFVFGYGSLTIEG
jgi:hypothetical protein